MKIVNSCCLHIKYVGHFVLIHDFGLLDMIDRDGLRLVAGAHSEE